MLCASTLLAGAVNWILSVRCVKLYRARQEVLFSQYLPGSISQLPQTSIVGRNEKTHLQGNYLGRCV